MIYHKFLFRTILFLLLCSYIVIEANSWVIDDGQKIRRDSISTRFEQGIDNPIWSPGQPIRLFALRNEILAFQVVVEAEDIDLNSVTVDLEQLTGPDGAIIKNNAGANDPTQFEGRYIERFVEHFFYIERESGSPWGNESLGWDDGSEPDGDFTGWMPDALIPVEVAPSWSPYPMNIKAGNNGIIWIDVYIPSNQTPGTYTGEVVVKNNGDQLETFELILEVEDKILPDWPVNTMYYYEYDALVQKMNTGNNIDKVEKHLWQLFHRHRISAMMQANDESQIDKLMQPLSGSLYTRENGYEGPGEGIGDGHLSLGTYGRYGSPDENDLNVVENIADRLADEGIISSLDLFIYVKDEDCGSPWADEWETLLANSTNPNIGYVKTGWTCGEKPSEQPVDIIMTGPGGYHPDEVEIAETSFNKECWVYNGVQPHSGTFFTDAPAVAPRVNGWIESYYNVDRWFYWETTFWFDWNNGGLGAYNPFVESETFHNNWGEWCNGDGMLIYPGRQEDQFTDYSIGMDGIIASIRLKNLRRGFQDAGYYQIARAVNPDEADAIAEQFVVPALGDATNNSRPKWTQLGKDFFDARYNLLQIFNDVTITPPNPPSNLSAKLLSQSQCKLTWNDNSNNENGFRIERSVDSTDWDEVGTVGLNVKDFVDSGLEQNKIYYYRVSSYNAGGNSDYSNIIKVATPIPPSVGIISPLNGESFVFGSDVTIAAEASDVDGYVSLVEFYDGNNLIGTDDSEPYEFLWKNVPNGPPHELTVKAFDNDSIFTISSSISIKVGGPNIALNKPVTVSSTEAGEGNIAANAVDGNLNTRWASGRDEPGWENNPQWIYIDLQNVYLVNRVVLRWEEAFASGYQIQVSDDANNWTDVYTTDIGDGNIDNILFNSINSRYVRVYATERGSIHAYSLWEFEVYDSGTINIILPEVSIINPKEGSGYNEPANISISAEATDSDGNVATVEFYAGTNKLGEDNSSPYSYDWENVVAGNYVLTAKAINNEGYTKVSSSIKIKVISSTTNLALNQPVVASSLEDSEDDAASNVVDGDMSTRWSSQVGNPQWIYVDLGSAYIINQVVLYWEYAKSAQYEIQLSYDASEWSTVYNHTDGREEVDNVTFSPETARYMRIYSTSGLSTGWNISLFEIEIYNNGTVSSVEKKTPISNEFTLSQNYPNPFNPTTNFFYRVPEPAYISIEIYNMLGEKIKTLVSEVNHQVGSYEVIWNGTNDSGQPIVSGVYLYTLTVNSILSETKKLVLLK